MADKFDYAKARATAEALITKFGEPTTLIIKGQAGGFDEFGDVVPDTPDTEITGIATPLLRYKRDEIDNSSILEDDAYIFFHSDDEPLIGMQHTQNGVTYRIISIVDITSVDGTNVYRKLQLRKG